MVSEIAADEGTVRGPISGNVCLNEAYRSSPGFWELLLFDSVSHALNRSANTL